MISVTERVKFIRMQSSMAQKASKEGDSGQLILVVESPKKLVKNWSNIDTWPGRLPFRTVENIPGRLPGSGRSPFIPRNSLVPRP